MNRGAVVSEASGRAVGSSMPHISPQGEKATFVAFYPGAQLVTFTPYTSGAGGDAWVGGVRGNVSGFSGSSRRRCLRTMAAVPMKSMARAVFVTLTYGSDWPDSPEAWHRQLDTFGKRLMRRYRRASFIWRMEAQERGAPHFHLLVFGVRFVPYQWVARVWAEVIGTVGTACEHTATETRRVRSARHAMHYVSKYLGKVGHAFFRSAPNGWFLEEVGRLWGIVGRRLWPRVEPVIRLVRSFGGRQRLLSHLAFRTGFAGLADYPAWCGGAAFGPVGRVPDWLEAPHDAVVALDALRADSRALRSIVSSMAASAA